MLFAVSRQSNWQTALFQVLLFPLLNKMFLHLQRQHLLKSYIFICGLMTNLQLLPCYFILKNKNVYEMAYLYLAKFFAFFVIEILLEIFINWLYLKIE